MRAVVIEAFGGPEVLVAGEVAEPTPGPDQVLVRVHAIGVNPSETKIRAGTFFMTPPLPAVLGVELAGEVERRGENVTGVNVGDRIVGWAEGPTGSYAEKALVGAFVSIPDAVTFEQAAAALVAAETASRVLGLLDPRPGELLLVHGASGAVGSIAVQLAVERGARVAGTAGPANLSYVESLGATAIQYGDGFAERFRATGLGLPDAVLDAAGAGTLRDSIALRGSTDRVITISDPDAQTLGVTMSYGLPETRDRSAVRHVLESIAAGRIRVRIAEAVPLTEAPRAHERVASGHAGGKVILVP